MARHALHYIHRGYVIVRGLTRMAMGGGLGVLAWWMATWVLPWINWRNIWSIDNVAPGGGLAFVAWVAASGVKLIFESLPAMTPSPPISRPPGGGTSMSASRQHTRRGGII
jgi:hypothetical protein